MKKAYVFVGLALPWMVLAASSCGSNDASTSKRDNGPAEKYNFPNHFNNVASKCDEHGNRIFVADHGRSSDLGSPLAVVRDPSCPGYLAPDHPRGG